MKASMLLVSAAAVACMFGTALAQTNSDVTKSPPPPKPKAEPPKADPKADPTKTEPKVEAPKPAVDKVSWVELKTSMGNIVIEVDGDKAPISAANFLTYVGEGFYDGTVFHRVIDKFMIQGGGFTTAGTNPDVTEKRPSHPAIKNEWKNGLKNKRGTVAMARTGDPDSATSQFYINVVDNDGPGSAQLDTPRGAPGKEAAYAVFGKVVSGMDVVDKIKAVKTGSHMMNGQQATRDIPDAPVVIEKARKLTAEEAKALKKDEAKPGATTPAPAPVIKPAPSSPTAPAPAPKPNGGGGR